MLVGGLLVLALWARLWSATLPIFDGPLRVRIIFERGTRGENEPIVATGRTGDGDFLTVKYQDPNSAVLSYDAWGTGGPDSPPFELQPGIAHELEIDMPSLAARARPAKGETRLLRVTLDGRRMLHQPVHFHARNPSDLYMALNPLGGSPAGMFRGRLTTLDGHPLRGRPTALFTTSERLVRILQTRFGELLGAVVMGVVVGFLTSRLLPAAIAWGRKLRTIRFAGRSVAPHGTFVVTALVCVAAFATLITGGTFRLIYPESFGNFYDHQAASLLHGRLDVPEAALSGEAFIVNGRYYGYFGVTPALLRLPFTLAHVGFGEWSRMLMIGYFAAVLAAAYALVCRATRKVTGDSAAWPSRVAILLLTTATGLGSTLFFLGSRAYIYHEAILAGAAFALWSTYFSLRYLDAPERRSWLPALVCGFLAVHARPPAGLFSLFVLGVVALRHSWSTCSIAFAAIRRPEEAVPRRSRWLGHVAIGAGAAIAMLSFSGLSYLKFGTFDGSPLRYSVQYTPERLARFEGKNFHLSNLGHNLDTYLFAPNFHLDRKFPYVFFGGKRHETFPEAKIDLEENTMAMPFAMAGLFACALAGGLWTVLAAPAALRRSVLVLVIGVGPMALALFTAIVTSHRYTGDFCAFLIALGACGLATIDAGTGRWRRVVLAMLGILTAGSVFLSVMASIQFQGEVVWGVAPEAHRNFEILRDWANRSFGPTGR